jgi:hypothetical protein
MMNRGADFACDRVCSASVFNGTNGSCQLALFRKYDENGNVIQQWFGGGQDLTLIIYLKKTFHQTCKIACDKHNPILSKI